MPGSRVAFSNSSDQFGLSIVFPHLLDESILAWPAISVKGVSALDFFTSVDDGGNDGFPFSILVFIGWAIAPTPQSLTL